jgi:lipoprotein-anchoring transpeptidase ErfK/SrfK
MIARVVVTTTARPEPGARTRGQRVAVTTAWSAQPQQLLVLGAATENGQTWLNVRLPGRPNGSAGWIPRDDVRLTTTPYWVSVARGARRVTIYRAGRRVRTFRGVVGAPGTPTPLGLAAIYERNRQPDPNGFLGSWSLPLTLHSNVLDNYDGGPGRVAIHGRAGASLLDPLGSARSHGCIRVDDRDVSWMAAHLPAGTPVQIRA